MPYLLLMNETDAAERAFEQVRKLPTQTGERVRQVVDEMLAEAEFERDLEGPEYRA